MKEITQLKKYRFTPNIFFVIILLLASCKSETKNKDSEKSDINSINKRKFDSININYFVPLVFDYSSFSNKNAARGNGFGFYPIGFSADWSKFASVQVSYNKDGKINNVHLHIHSFIPEVKIYGEDVPKLDSIINFEVAWNSNYSFIRNFLVKHEIIQPPQLDFINGHQNFNVNKNEIALFIKRGNYLTLSNGEKILQSKFLRASFNRGKTRVVDEFYDPLNMATVKDFEIIGLFPSEKYAAVLCIHNSGSFLGIKRKNNYQLMTLPLPY